MFESSSLEDFLSVAEKGRRVALFAEYPADLITPISACQILENAGFQITLLESGEKEAHVGRHSCIGIDPIAEFRATGQQIEETIGGSKRSYEGDPLERLRSLHKEFAARSSKPLPGFVGGAVGYLSYDAVRLFEKIPEKNAHLKEVPDLFFQFYERGVFFDHRIGLIRIMATIEITGDPQNDYERGMERLREVFSLFIQSKSPLIAPFMPSKELSEVSVDLDDESFKKLVVRAKEHIIKGDAFQIVVSRAFTRPYYSDPFAIYRALRLISPSPYMFFFRTEDFSIAGASPEKLVSLTGDKLETIPLAGTRPRGVGLEDIKREKDLLNDPKEDAEHMMLVDLSRNDLGLISTPGSVVVDQLKVVQRFSHVMHIASFVQGKIKKGHDFLDALRATFPAGTLSGAPKIRAMEIIDGLELAPRGVYGGSVCMIDAEGNLETCIVIRTALLKDGIATVRAGAGVVYDSDPQKEADETRHKARSALKAIQLAEEGKI